MLLRTNTSFFGNQYHPWMWVCRRKLQAILTSSKSDLPWHKFQTKKKLQQFPKKPPWSLSFLKENLIIAWCILLGPPACGSLRCLEMLIAFNGCFGDRRYVEDLISLKARKHVGNKPKTCEESFSRGGMPESFENIPQCSTRVLGKMIALHGGFSLLSLRSLITAYMD